MKLVNPLYGWYYHSDISIDQVAYRFYSPRFYNDQLISRVLGEWLASFVALKFEPALRIQGYSENDEQADKLLNEFAEDEENPGLENLKSRRSSLASTGFNSAYSSNQSLAFETLIIHSRNSSLDNSHSRISVSHSRRASIFVERAFVANLGNPIQEEAALVSKNSESNFVELPEPTGSELDFFARKSLIEVNQESSPSVLEPSVENGDIAQGNEKIGTSETNNDDLITSRSIELPESTSTAEEKTIEDKKLKELRPINLGRYTYDSKKVVTAIEEDENESIEAEEAISKSLPSLAGGLKPIKESQENTLHGSNNSSIQSHQSNMTSTEDIKVSVAEDKAIKKSAEELASIGQEDEIAIHLTSENAESGNDDVNVVKSIKSDNEMHQVNEAIPVQEIAHFSDNLVTSIGEIIESLIDVAVSTKLNDIELQNDSKGDVKDSIEEVEESTKSSQVSEESTKSSKVITDEIIAENVSEVKETLPELATISSSLNRDISSAEHSISKKSDVKNSNDEILITEIEKKSSYHEIVSETGPIKSKLDESKKELNQNAKDLVDDLRPNSSNVFINSIVDGLINEIAKEEQVKQEIAESGSFDTENPAIDDTDDIEITKEEEEQVDTKGSLEHLIDKTETIKPLTAKKIQPVELLDPKKTYESLLNIVKSEKPELEIIQKMALQFIELKVQTAPELTFYNDQEAIHNVISHAYPKTNHDYISLVLKSSFPELEVDLDVITQRPPPFPEFIKESYSVYESDARFNEWPKFKRKDRNSKASGFWNDETGFRVGQGVLSYYR